MAKAAAAATDIKLTISSSLRQLSSLVSGLKSSFAESLQVRIESGVDVSTIGVKGGLLRAGRSLRAAPRLLWIHGKF